ncbi:hypothetical protein LX32DRAFT_375826 [Colletotrichum zoysiae]|uniref:Uncharacterized protein n=1 Tax=Colletotrichum zoysiae TaxID=1216348 RepID=A0AAD9M241_9PEZI|nr:hypothetical protein LX32DRAFT_375826 [Colletotrichum zoysiae]
MEVVLWMESCGWSPSVRSRLPVTMILVLHDQNTLSSQHLGSAVERYDDFLQEHIKVVDSSPILLADIVPRQGISAAMDCARRMPGTAGDTARARPTESFAYIRLSPMSWGHGRHRRLSRGVQRIRSPILRWCVSVSVDRWPSMYSRARSATCRYQGNRPPRGGTSTAIILTRFLTPPTTGPGYSDAPRSHYTL